MQRTIKQQELYKVAIDVFAQYGYKKATVEDIADRMGLTKGAIYQYVKSKKELYDKALHFKMNGWHTSVMGIVDEEGNFEKRFEALCRKSFSYLDENESFKKILAEDPNVFPMSFRLDPYKEINEKSVKYLEKFIVQGVEQGIVKDLNTQVAAKFIFSVYKMIVVTTYVLDQKDKEEVVDTAIEIVTKGLFKLANKVK